MIGRITTSGSVTLFDLPPYRDPGSITAGPDGALWFTEGAGLGSGTFVSGIGRLTTSGHLVEFGSDVIEAEWIVAGPDRALWFTDRNEIVRMSSTGHTKPFSVVDSSLDTIAAGPDSALWFTLPGQIGRMTTAGEVTLFSILARVAPSPAGIVAGADGAMWFVESGGNKVGRITTGVTAAHRQAHPAL